MSREDPDPSPLPVDSLGLWGWTVGLPEQLAEAAGPVEDLGLGTDPRLVVLAGSGAAGLAADAVAALVGSRLPVPLLVWTGGPWPVGAVGPETLVFALSGTGHTTETRLVAEAAQRAGASVVAVSGGGPLADQAEAWVPLPAGPERALFGALVGRTVAGLEAFGLLAGARQEVAQAASWLAEQRDVLVRPAGTPSMVARRLGRTIPLVYGAAGPGAVAARRWKSQWNLNAKAPAFWAAVPGACHDELAGWGQQGDVTRQVLTLVTLRAPGEEPAADRCFDEVAQWTDEVVAAIVEVRAAASTPLAALFELVLVGDLASLLVAGREGVDPGPVPVEGRSD